MGAFNNPAARGHSDRGDTLPFLPPLIPPISQQLAPLHAAPSAPSPTSDLGQQLADAAVGWDWCGGPGAGTLMEEVLRSRLLIVQCSYVLQAIVSPQTAALLNPALLLGGLPSFPPPVYAGGFDVGRPAAGLLATAARLPEYPASGAADAVARQQSTGEALLSRWTEQHAYTAAVAEAAAAANTNYGHAAAGMPEAYPWAGLTPPAPPT